MAYEVSAGGQKVVGLRRRRHQPRACRQRRGEGQPLVHLRMRRGCAFAPGTCFLTTYRPTGFWGADLITKTISVACVARNCFEVSWKASLEKTMEHL